MSKLPPSYTGKKRGRKKGSVLEMINLTPGGRGRLNTNRLSNESAWLLDTKSDNESGSDMEYCPSDDTDEGEESDETAEEEANCISALDGN